MTSRTILLCAMATAAALTIGTTRANDGEHRDNRTLDARLQGFQEVPAISSPGRGDFRAKINSADQTITYRLRYEGLEGDVSQAHIHIAQAGVNGRVVVFLCTNLGNGPPGTQSCPQSGEVTGTITPVNVLGGASPAAAQGIDAMDFDGLADALRNGVGYVNVHSSLFPGGEIRGQLRAN